MILNKRNQKVNAEILLDRYRLKRFITILDADVVPNFTSQIELPADVESRIEQNDLTEICDGKRTKVIC